MNKYFFLVFIFIGQITGWSQTVDTTKNELYAWKLNEGHLIENTELDTTINSFQIFNPIEKQSICYSYLGNLGSPARSNIYFTESNENQDDFIFDRNYNQYVLSHKTMLFYHSKKPFFDLSWASGTKKRDENQVSALYTQNINKKLNVGFRYKLISSLGEIPRNKTAEHSLNLFTSYIGEKYSIHASFIRNKFKNQESGGINDSLNATPEFSQPLLSNASSVYFKRDIFISQQYKFGYTEKIVVDDTTTESTFHELGRFNYIFLMNKNNRTYQEGETDRLYYNNTYFATPDSISTRDSMAYSRIENTLYFTFKEIEKENFKGRLTVGGSHEYLLATGIDNSYAFFREEKYSNIKLSSNLDARTKNFIFSVKAYYYPKISSSNAHKSGSYYGNVLIDKAINIGKWRPAFYFNLSHSSIKPYLTEQSYTSIHFRWDNDFKNRINTDFKLGFKIPQAYFDLNLAYGVNQNEIYYDSLALPVQYGDFMTIRSIRLQKDFHFGGFVMVNKLAYQAVSNNDEVISIPKLAFYNSTYYDLDRFLKEYSIQVQLGYELYYTSQYYTPGYMPSSALFYQQRIRQTGEFPVINVFLNLRIKTVLLFIKFENVYNQFLINKFYYYTNNYPINTTAFKFGVSWRFMD
jgi:hypothetical protein